MGKTKERFAQWSSASYHRRHSGHRDDCPALGIAMTGSLQVGEVGDYAWQTPIFLVATLVVGLIAVPRLLAYVARFKATRATSRCWDCVSGFRCWPRSSATASPWARYSWRDHRRGPRNLSRRGAYRPIRALFSAIFFVTIGLLIDPTTARQYWLPVVIITIAVVLGQSLTCALGHVCGRQRHAHVAARGHELAQIGEFSSSLPRSGFL